MAFIATTNESGAEQRIALEDDPIIIGRHPDCAFVIKDNSVSRQHAQIIKKDNEFLVEDLKSRNGTFLNNRAVHQPTRLFHGDKITVCDTEFTFKLDDAPVARRTTDERPVETSGSILFEDDPSSNMSSIMSHMDISSHYSKTQLVSPEEKLKTLLDITRALSKTISLETVAATILDCLFDLFVQSDRGFILVKDQSGALQPLVSKIRRARDDEQIRVSNTIVNHVMESHQAIISSDAGIDSRFDMSQSVADVRIRSLMCAPLLNADGKSLGVIQLDTLRSSIGFKNEDLELLSTVAMQAGIAVENTKLHQIEMDQHAMRRDLQLAHDVQRGFLPRSRPVIAGHDFFDYYRPAQQVGGDYYDYLILPDGRIAVILADVVGHGVAAALLMAKFSAEARFALVSTQSPAKAVERLNSAVYGLDLDRFVTMILCVLVPETRQLTVVNAGHPKAILRRATGETELFEDDNSGIPIGIDDPASYNESTLNLEPGDQVFVYTDGILDCANADDEPFGMERIVGLLNTEAPDDLGRTGEMIIERLRDHVGDIDQLDDVCLVGLGCSK